MSLMKCEVRPPRAPNCHRYENCLQHSSNILRASPPANPGVGQMQTIFDRLFSFIDHYFDREWAVIWTLDDL